MSIISPRFTYGDLDLTAYPFGVEFGTDLGAPESVAEVVASLIADGDLVDVERVTNRELTMTIIVEGSDMKESAEAEALLAREAGRPVNTLSIDPGDGIGAVTVFQSFRASLAFARQDTHEIAGYRRFVLTIPALPYGRSTSLTTTEATAVPSVGDIVNDADSLTGWSATSPGGVSLDTVTFYEGTASVAVTPYTGPATSGGTSVYTYEATLTQAIDVDTGGYLSFVVRHEGSAVQYFSNSDDPYTGEPRQGQIVSEVREFTITSSQAGVEQYRYDDPGYYFLEHRMQDFIVQTLPGGWKRYTLRLPEPRTISSLKWKGYEVVPAGAASPTTRFDQVAVAESATLGAQVLKTISVGGSARTPGSIHIGAPTDVVGLGQVVVYTIAADRVRAGFRPDLRQWDDGTGATTPDTDATNGSYYTALGTNENYTEVSPALLAPASMFNSTAHTMIARTQLAGSPGSELYFGVQAQLVVDDVEVGEPLKVERTFTATGSTDYSMIPLGSLYLPPLPIAGANADAVVRFRFRGNVFLDELYAFPVDGDLSIIDCREGTAGPDISSHLWIDSPSATQPQGGYWRGATGERVNAVSAWPVANVPGTHVFDAGDVLLFAASTGTLGPTADVSFYKSWLFNAPE